MPNVVIKTLPWHIIATGLHFMQFANRYNDAAMMLEASESDQAFDPVLYHLYCQSLELHLKSFIWLKCGTDSNTFKNHYRHDLALLWKDSKTHGISRFASVTKLRNDIIALVSPFYCKRRFSYLDVDMAFRGAVRLRSEKRITPTLRRLNIQLGRSLRSPILRAS